MKNKHRNHLKSRCLVVTAVASLLLAGAHARTWTSADGAKTFEGELQSYDAASGKVGVILSNGKRMTFEQDTLSADDIAWLKENDNRPAGSRGAGSRPTLAVADLDGVAGKVFDLNPDGSFRFLKQDVQIDPETGKGQAWFAAYAGKDVEIVQREDRKNLATSQQRSVDDLKEGSWRATLSGKLESGRFVVDKMQLNPLPDQVKDDDPKLPRVLSMGDSISMNYEQAARENLKGIANYHRITDNSWSTARCKSFVSYWMGDYTKPGRGWDVILFNSGLHDMKQKELGGAYAMPLDDYRKNLRIWIEQMKPTGATLMYVTTTPVQNDSGSAKYAFRTKGAEDDFNNAAREVLKDYPEILICDLAGEIDNSPEFDNWRKGRDVHFWKAGEQVLVGKAVAGSVKKALEVRRKRN